MALTITTKARERLGGTTWVVCEVAFDNSYPTGGEAISINDFGLSNIFAIIPHSEDGKLIEYDSTNKKLLVKHFDYAAVGAGAAIEVANASDQATFKPIIIVIGTG